MEGEEKASKEICKFYKEGICRFGEDCFNLHQGPCVKPKESKKVKKVEKEVVAVKKSMKTASDVIRRIQWDEMLPAESFTIGYLDRFTGLVEDEFTKFSNWGNLADAEYDALAIPQHRIEYFKYKGFKVWDKKSRMDLVFGSSGDNQGKSIEDIMNDIDDNLKNARFNEEYDSDSEDDIDIEIESNIQAICNVPEEARSTHFIAVRITNPEIVQAARNVQKDVIEQEEALADCCMGLGLFHITLSMLRLEGKEGADELSQLLQDLKPQLQELSRTLKLRISGLGTFGQRVLFAKVLPEPEDNFWQFVSLLNNQVAQTSEKVNVTNKFELTPHMTLVKVNRPIAKLRKSKYLPSALYESHNDDFFGIQYLDNLQLCVIEDTTRADGFYRTLTELSLYE